MCLLLLLLSLRVLVLVSLSEAAVHVEPLVTLEPTVPAVEYPPELECTEEEVPAVLPVVLGTESVVDAVVAAESLGAARRAFTESNSERDEDPPEVRLPPFELVLVLLESVSVNDVAVVVVAVAVVVVAVAVVKVGAELWLPGL